MANSTTVTTFTANSVGSASFNIATGTTQGTISVGSVNVSVAGLNSAAYVAETSFFKTNRGTVNNAYVDLAVTTENATGYENLSSGTYSITRDGHSELLVEFAKGTGSTSALELMTNYSDNSTLYYRKTVDAKKISGPWRAFLTETNYTTFTYSRTEAEGKFVPYETSSTLTSVNGTNSNPCFYNYSGSELVSGYKSYWHVINLGKHTGDNYASQIAMNYHSSISDTDMFIRTANNATWREWRRVWHSGNLTSLTAADGGTGISLVTTNEKYVWGNKMVRLQGGTNLNPSDTNVVQLNNITTIGNYYTTNANNSKNYVQNKPQDNMSMFRLQVGSFNSATQRIFQRFMESDTIKAYMRTSSTETVSWSDWKLIQDDLSQYLLLSGGTLSGKVNTSTYNAGIYGNYQNAKHLLHIWAISTSYAMDSGGQNPSNLYGLAYFHHQWSNDSTQNTNYANKTPLGDYAHGHQVGWFADGVLKGAIGSYVWSAGGFIKKNCTSTDVLTGDGGSVAKSNMSVGYSDKVKVYNLFRDYPDKLTEEEKALFDRENPFWAEYFKLQPDREIRG